MEAELREDAEGVARVSRLPLAFAEGDGGAAGRAKLSGTP
jgi:hypothetical protein